MMSVQYRMAHNQSGAATLVMALVIMTAISLLTLTVARTRLTEQRMESAQAWNGRLLNSAESAWHDETVTRALQIPSSAWQPTQAATAEVFQTPSRSNDRDISTQSTYRRAAPQSPWLELAVTASRTDGGGQRISVTQRLRLLSVLSPLAETAPPLILAGCLSAGSAQNSIRPLRTGPRDKGIAVWNFAASSCATLAGMDLAGGAVIRKTSPRPLWDTLFSVSRAEYGNLARLDAGLPAAERRYWQADPAGSSVWRNSLGSSSRPVVLYFPSQYGCPQFSAGLRLFGFVFIDAPCPDSITASRVEIYGTLAVNGALHAGTGALQLQHIQHAAPRMTRLDLPFLRAVPVPGSWRDF